MCDECLLLTRTVSFHFLTFAAPSEDKDWDELTAEEKKAAEFLGYNQAKWDAEDSSDED